MWVWTGSPKCNTKWEPWDARAFEWKLSPQEMGQPQDRAASPAGEVGWYQRLVASASPVGQTITDKRSSDFPSECKVPSWHLTRRPELCPKQKSPWLGDHSKGGPSKATHAQGMAFIPTSSFLVTGRTFSRPSQCFHGIFREQKHLSQ